MFGPHDQHFRKGFCREITQLQGIQPNLIVSLLCFPNGADYIPYDADHWPNSFPLLIARAHDDGHPAVHLEFCYLSEDGAVEERLYQIPGKGRVQIDRYDSGHYTIEAVTETRTRATLNFWVSGGDRKVRYVYLIEDNRVRPQSYQLTAYFGWMFKALPLSLLATCIFIFICKQVNNLISKRMALRKLKFTA